jgi:hypothetical protein
LPIEAGGDAHSGIRKLMAVKDETARLAGARILYRRFWNRLATGVATKPPRLK